MPAMRLSLTARFVTHPTIDFGLRRASSRRPRLGLGHAATVYLRPVTARQILPTVAALRSQTSRYSFPSVARPGRVRDRRTVLPTGLSRARRA
jgi:hypothetical protein